MPPGIQPDGTFVRKSRNEFAQDLMTAAQSIFGTDADLSVGSPLRDIIDVVAQEMSDQDQRLADIYYAGYIGTATATSLDRLVAILGIVRQDAVAATGTLRFSRAVAGPTISIPMGTLARDSLGNTFQTTASGSLTGTSVDIAAEAVTAGGAGNVAGNTITTIVNPIGGVEAVTNPSAFTGGEDDETDADLRARVRLSIGTGGAATLDAIRASLIGVNGVTSAKVFENTGQQATTDDTVFVSTQTGTASQTIDATTRTKQAQLIAIGADQHVFTQWWRQKITTVSGTPTFTVRLETDSGGSPSGTLVNQVFERAGYTPTSGVLEAASWANGAYITSGAGTTVWLVWVCTSGSATFDGGTGGTADQVKTFSAGSWTLSTTVENLNCNLLGGIPPGGIRPLVAGSGAANDIARAIGTKRAAGVPSDGMTSGTWTDDNQDVLTEWWNVPTEVTIYVTVTLSGGNATSVESAVISYIGGTDASSVTHLGLGIGADVIYNKVVEAVMNVAGVMDATITMGTSPTPVGTANIAISNTQVARATTASVVVS